MIGNEYSTGMIRLSLTATPRRLILLGAKLAVHIGPVLLASAIAVGASMVTGRLVLPGHGFTPGHGYTTLTHSFELGGAGEWRAAFGTAVYLTLIAVLSLGVATAMRDSAAAIGTKMANNPVLSVSVIWHRGETFGTQHGRIVENALCGHPSPFCARRA
jgi:ABC-2 type transport system permease protein